MKIIDQNVVIDGNTTQPILPKKMQLTQGDQRITLIIHSWSLK